MNLPFIRQDEITKSLSVELSKDNDRRSRSNRATTFRPSQITQCPRRIFYRVQGIDYECHNSFYEESHLKFLSDKWIYFLSKCKSIKVIDTNVLVAHARYNISGTIEAYIQFKDTIFMVKVKSADIAKIREKGVNRKDIVEIATYLWMAELYDALLIYEDNVSKEYEIFHIEPYEPIINTVKTKCNNLIKNQLSGVEPMRLKGATESCKLEECKKCEYSRICLNNLKKNKTE